ncbi:MAG: SDR family NAD(P)-dependent oxidoreductase [Boseongicola sp.]|nr:SDR family NAD(P)-dependent oxidoreductase [Boseongicola sp.]MDD9979564.1 SDR family NAD(P)-dependent oxidoreductase [Boseongicola sp.]
MEIGSGTSAVVTGGASGLGAAVTRALAERGARVAIFDLNSDAGLEVASEISGVFCNVDVTDSESVAAGLESARARHGQERICVNCAGIAPAAKTVSRGTAHDLATFRQVIDINLVGSFNVASQSAAGMVADGGGVEAGVIIHTASIAAFEGQIGQVAYAASKGGIAGLTLPMARDLARDGVRVMAIAPGIFGTPMVTSMSEELQEALASGIPNPARLGDPSEFAALACHIIENQYMNGTVIRLDGAVRLAPR